VIILIAIIILIIVLLRRSREKKTEQAVHKEKATLLLTPGFPCPVVEAMADLAQCPRRVELPGSSPAT
jgi:hypothetical protein